MVGRYIHEKVGSKIVTLPQIGAPKIATLPFEWTHKKRTHHGDSCVKEAIVCSSLYFVSRLLFVSNVSAIGDCSTRALLLKSTSG